MASEPSPQQAVQAVYAFAADLMRRGFANYEIERHLVERGLSTEAAQVVVTNLNQMRRDAVRGAALKNMAKSGIICVIGLVVTLATYSMAASSPTGGRYVVAWGAVVFGGIAFFRALMQYLQA